MSENPSAETKNQSWYSQAMQVLGQVINYLLSSTLKRVFSSLIALGVYLVADPSILEMLVRWAINLTSETTHTANAVGFGQWVGLGMIVSGILLHIGLHRHAQAEDAKSERTKQINEVRQFAGLLKSLADDFRIEGEKPCGYKSDELRDIKTHAQSLSKLDLGTLTGDKTLAAIRNGGPDAAGKEIFLGVSVKDADALAKRLEDWAKEAE